MARSLFWLGTPPSPSFGQVGLPPAKPSQPSPP